MYRKRQVCDVIRTREAYEGSFQPQVHMVSATEYFFSDATDEEVLGADFYANIFLLQ